jgi:hypothetical protein
LVKLQLSALTVLDTLRDFYQMVISKVDLLSDFSYKSRHTYRRE